MGKKYIIELEDKPFHKEDGDFLYRVKGFNSLVFDMTGISKLAHYHEPDLGLLAKENFERGYRQRKAEDEKDIEQVKKEAYDKGYDDAKGGYENGFENGMIVAWDAARKIIRMPEVDLLNLFTECYSAVCTSLQVFLKYDASECIEKIRQYEQEQEEQIQVGDEVIPRETEYDTMIVTRLWKDDYDSDCIDAIGFDGRIGSFLVSRVSKTGKHYEIAAVLEKMRGEQEQ